MDPVESHMPPPPNNASGLAQQALCKARALIVHAQALAEDAETNLLAITKHHTDAEEAHRRALAQTKATEQCMAEFKGRVDQCLDELNDQIDSNYLAAQAYLDDINSSYDNPAYPENPHFLQAFQTQQTRFQQAREQWNCTHQHYQQALAAQQQTPNVLIFLKQQCDDTYAQKEKLTLHHQYSVEILSVLQEHCQLSHAAYQQSSHRSLVPHPPLTSATARTYSSTSVSSGDSATLADSISSASLNLSRVEESTDNHSLLPSAAILYSMSDTRSLYAASPISTNPKLSDTLIFSPSQFFNTFIH